MGKKVAAAALAASFLFGSAAMADPNPGEKFINNPKIGLNKCSDNKKFKKNRDKQIKGLQRRQKLYEEGSSVYDSLSAGITKVKKRNQEIMDSGRYCETASGYPVFIADPGLQLWLGRSTDMLLPTVGFVYLTCWLSQSAKNYLNWIRNTSKNAQEARDRELFTNWDYKMALKFLVKGWAWPVEVANELRTNKLKEDPKYIKQEMPPL